MNTVDANIATRMSSLVAYTVLGHMHDKIQSRGFEN